MGWGWVDAENKDTYLTSVADKLIINPLYPNFDDITQITKDSIMNDYVNGMGLINLKDKYSLTLNLIKMIMESETLPLIVLQPDEIFKNLDNGYYVSNMGRIIKNNRLYNRDTIKKTHISIIVGKLFLNKPNKTAKIRIINPNLPCSINNLEWVVAINEEIIKEDYKTSITTRKELAIKYDISENKLNIILKDINWRDTPRFEIVADKARIGRNQSATPHKCKICNDTNPLNFYKKTKSKCKECANVKKYYIKKDAKPHHCKICDQTNPEFFTGGKKSKCKKCSSDEKKANYVSVKKRPKF